VIGVRAIAGVCVGAPLFVYALGVLFLPSLPTPTLVVADFVGLLVGAAALAASFWRDLGRHARWMGFALGAGTALVETIGMTSSASFQWEVMKTTPEAQFPPPLAIVIPIGVAVLLLAGSHAGARCFHARPVHRRDYLRHGPPVSRVGPCFRDPSG
jgi:hypothetical protein